MELKYIIVMDSMGDEIPIVFHKNCVHRDVGWRMAVVSAGFVLIGDGPAVCFGRSESLGIDSRPDEDTKLVNKYIFGK